MTTPPGNTEPTEITVAGRQISRRTLLAGVGGVGAVAVAAGTAGVLLSDDETAVTPTPTPAPSPTAPRAEAEATAPPRRATPARSAAVGGQIRLSGLPEGMALVSSPRLPLFGVGPDDLGRLIAGQVADWRALGSAVSLRVEPLAIEGQVPDGMAPTETYADYDALVAGLDERLGGVALIPLDAVDFRVNVLSVGLADPLRDQEDVIRIGVVGDIVPGRNVHNKMVAYGDFTHPFREIAGELSSYDLTFANLEGNLSGSIPPPSDAHTFNFVSDPAMIDGFKLAGIDAVSLANNHSTWNSAGWGVQALLDTIDSLEAGELPHFGAGRTLDEARAPWVSTVKGKSIAIFGIDGVTANQEASEGVLADYVGATADSPGTNPFSTDQFLADIAAAVEQYDIVIPYVHCGVEYVGVPPAWAIEGAHAAIDVGATMVVTNHPHVIQGMEVYQGKPIVYSVGNFIFDQMFGVEVRQGLILEIAIQGDRVVGIRCRGVEIEDFNQPRLMSAGEQASIMDRFWRSTDRIAGR